MIIQLTNKFHTYLREGETVFLNTDRIAGIKRNGEGCTLYLDRDIFRSDLLIVYENVSDILEIIQERSE